MATFQVTAKTGGILSHRLVVSANSGLTSPTYSSAALAADGFIRLTSPDLASGDWYWGIEQDGVLTDTPRGQASVPSASHSLCFSSCAVSGSNDSVFSQIESEGTDMFFHLGDMHYQQRTSTDETLYLTDFSQVFNSPNQASLYANIPTAYMPSDNDGGGGNNHSGNTGATSAAAGAWRKRVPHPTLELSGEQDGRYFSFDVGRVRYAFTDQRAFASPNANTDDSSKTMLGATQKTWLLDLIENSSGFLIVWVCTRLFHANTNVGSDSWGGFTTEREEICDQIQTHASGRVCILSADSHRMGIV